MAPFLVRAGHQVECVDTDLYRRSTFGQWEDGTKTRVEVAERSGLSFPEVWKATRALEGAGLPARAGAERGAPG